MSDADEKKPTDLCPAYIAYYEKLASDLTRYRNFRWYIPIWTVTFLGAVSAIAKGISPDEPNIIRVAATVVICGVAAVSMWQLWNCYRCYAKNRTAVRGIESKYDLLALGLKKGQEKRKEADDSPSLTWQHRVFKWSWIALIIVVMLYALYCVWPQEGRRLLSWLLAPR